MGAERIVSARCARWIRNRESSLVEMAIRLLLAPSPIRCRPRFQPDQWQQRAMPCPNLALDAVALPTAQRWRAMVAMSSASTRNNDKERSRSSTPWGSRSAIADRARGATAMPRRCHAQHKSPVHA